MIVRPYFRTGFFYYKGVKEMKTFGDRLRDIGTILNFLLPFVIIFVLLPLELYFIMLLTVLYILVTARVIVQTSTKKTNQDRKLSARIRYRIYHSLFEVKSYSTRIRPLYKGKHDLEEVVYPKKYRSYKRYEIQASIKEVPFIYYEETLIPRMSIYKHPGFSGFVVSLKSNLAKEFRILDKMYEFSQFYDGYVVLNVGEIKFYVNSEQYIHTIYENGEIKEQVSKIYNDVLKLSQIKESIEKILQEDYKS